MLHDAERPRGPRPALDAELVAKLRDPAERSAFLAATVAALRDGMAWAASNLPPEARERQLLEVRLQTANDALALVEAAGRPEEKA